MSNLLPFLPTLKMASLIVRQGARLVRRNVLLTSVRASSASHAVVDPLKGKVPTDQKSMPDNLGHSVGAERFELLSQLAGNEDPFEMNVKKRAKGTFDEPTLVPSINTKRLVGCICEEDAISINWMYLHKGEPKRCECGYWFKLAELQPVNLS
ncbi:cytochrome c oxidase subunit 5B, mitochondrial-like [Liolophura sinensis]|uniref:cytochrome c oxidase subunit 5B, mitochondrial-like n=1 Tax=Liolophura sinensis TaxID=3198878 RepID=UPI00315892BA